MSLESDLIECDELYDSCDFRGLIVKCDEMLEKYPDNQNAMGYKGIAHCFLDEYDDAVKILERGIELFPDNYYLKNNLSMVYYDLGEYEKSLKVCDDGLKIKDFDWLCENKFKNLIKLGRLDEAVEFAKAKDYQLVLPLIFLDGDMKGHELEYYEYVLKIDPENSEVKSIIEMITKD